MVKIYIIFILKHEFIDLDWKFYNGNANIIVEFDISNLTNTIKTFNMTNYHSTFLPTG